MREYLKNYGIKTVAAHKINYGGQEYAAPKPGEKTLKVLVDFAHGKPIMMIHTDHHDKQIGAGETSATAFVQTPSNAEWISDTMSPRDIFPPADLKTISTIDSADFYSQGINPDDIINAAFKINKDINVSKNRMMMGFVVNKMLLSLKNKPNFLDDLVMTAKPSLVNMYHVIIKVAKDNGFDPSKEIPQNSKNYQNQQKEKIRKGNLNDITSLKNGDSMQIGTTIVQYGGGWMGGGIGSYDRYTPFKLYPSGHFLLIGWPMGLVQLSKNPFKGKSKYHLGKVVMDVLKKHKSSLSRIDVTLNDIKRIFERDVKIADAMGFTFEDFVSNLGKKANIKSPGFREVVRDIAGKPYSKLTNGQKNVLKKISVTAWDIIQSQSGGHKDITNVSGINFIGKGYADWMKKFMQDIAKEMKDKTLDK